MNVKVKAWLTAPIAACVLCLTATDAEAQTQHATTAGTVEPPLHEQYLYRNPAQPSKDPRELKDSQYRGFHYEAKYEPFRKCVMSRESGGNYRAHSEEGWGSGAYQFTSATWRLAMLGIGAPEWAEAQARYAPPAYQDEAFWYVANPYPKLSGLRGKHHWSTDHTYNTIGKRGVNCEKWLPGDR